MKQRRVDMSAKELEREERTVYNVLVNQEKQYCVWPEYNVIPAGWSFVGKTGTKADCLSYIKEIWTDMRPFRVQTLTEQTPREETGAADPSIAAERPLVDRLCEGIHSVQVSVRPEKSIALFKEAIDRKFVHIRFANTRGGTEVGIQLDTSVCDCSKADFDHGSGAVHLEGSLTLDFVRVRCVADVLLPMLEGTGHLVRG
jgi:uncharacterized protein YbdZ (MbtH family)